MRRPPRYRRARCALALALLGSLPLAAGPIAAAPAAAAPPAATAGQIRPVDPRHAPTVALRHLKTGERYGLRLFDATGTLRTEALGDLRRFLRCTRTGVDHPIHWRLVTILVAVAAHYPGREVVVVSGYRHPKVSRHAKRSNHTRGRALDFRVEGVPNRELRDLVRGSFSGIGVGYYPNSSFVHVDVREREGQWIDYAGPGQDACYSPNVRGDFRSGLAEGLSYEAAIARGCRGHGPPAGDRGPGTARPADDENDEHEGTRPVEDRD